ncbi:MAG: MOSC domain-containing protein [Pseudomonadota bacterium]
MKTTDLKPPLAQPCATIIGLYTGRISARWAGKPPSAIGKTRQDRPLRVSTLGLEGDEQADPEAHGGPDQALHHYPADHMKTWQRDIPKLAHIFVPGCFGENISSTGFTESNMCIGDILSLGTSFVQITQGRRPCWKLDAHIGHPQMAYHFRKTARTGWYYRVLEQGEVEPGCLMRVLDRPLPEWSVFDVTTARFAARLDPGVADQLANLPHLSDLWRRHFAKMQDG